MKRKIWLDVSPKRGHLTVVGGALPYIWIGNETCFGCIPEENVQDLRDICDQILHKRTTGIYKRKKP